MSASKRAQDAAEIIYPVYSWVKSSLGRTENHQRLSELAKKIGRPPKMIRYWMRHKVIPFVRIKKVVFFEEAKVRRALDEMHTAWEALMDRPLSKTELEEREEKRQSRLATETKRLDAWEKQMKAKISRDIRAEREIRKAK